MMKLSAYNKGIPSSKHGFRVFMKWTIMPAAVNYSRDTFMAGLNRICTFLRQLVTILAHYSSNCTQGNGQLYSLSSTNFLRLFSKTQSIDTCISYNYVLVHKKNWPRIFILLTNRMLYISFFLLTIANYNVYVLVACWHKSI